MSQSRRPHAHLAFTMIELLVVITVIVLLVALLLPALRSARDQAKATVCGSNLRQMGVMAFAYASDQGDFPDYAVLHRGVPVPNGQDMWAGWNNHGGAIIRGTFLPKLVKLKYLATEEVGFCPEAWGMGFRYDFNTGLGRNTFVDMSGSPGNPPWWGAMAFQSGGDSGGFGHMNRGEYLWWGPGAHSWTLNRNSVSGLMLRDINPTATEIWVYGVHADGFVGDAGNYNRPSARYVNERMPLMGEGQRAGPNWTNPRQAPHRPNPRLESDYRTSGGLMNYLYSDGSVETWEYRDQ